MKFLKGINIKKGDIVIAAAILIISGIVLIAGFFDGGRELNAELYLNGNLIQTIRLSSIEEPVTVELGGCTALIESDGISVIRSNCKNQLCVKQGKMSLDGACIACVPNKAVIIIESEKQNADVIAY